MRSNFLSISIIAFLGGCRFSTSTFEQANTIQRLGQPLKVEYFRNIVHRQPQYKETPEFTIINEAAVAEIVNEIKQAKQPELWKGAAWDKIVITYADTTVLLHTDTKKIGLSASGIFYYLDKNNFITKRLPE